MNQHITIIKSDPSDETLPHLVLHCPHGGTLADLKRNDEGLWKRISSASRASGVRQEDLEDFIGIEADCFSFELAEAIASILRQRIKGIRIEIIKICIPRALLDMNRKLSHAVGQVFFFEQFPKLKQELEEYQRDGHRLIQERLLRLETVRDIEPSGTLVEIHTMGPVTPEEIPVSPTTLRERVQVWKALIGEPRQVDIIDENEENGQRHIFGDQEICNEIQRLFGDRAVRNHPYWSRPELLSHEWSSLVDSHVVLDFPKHFLSKEDLDDEAFPLHSLRLDDRKLFEMAGTVSDALVSILERRLTVTSA